MIRRSAVHHAKAFGIAIFLGALILLLILVSTGIKLFLLFSQSTFDGKHQFVIEEEEPHSARFVVFNPDSQTVISVLLTGQLPTTPEVSLGIPIDARVVSPNDFFAQTLTRTLLFHRSSLQSTINPVDAGNLFFFTNITRPAESTVQDISLSANQESQDSVFSKVFLDQSIYKEAKGIAIVNGTGVAGLGSKIAQLCVNIGANVISTTTADVPSPLSSVGFSGQESYTALRLAHLLHLPLVHLSTVAISDITITLGTDKANSF